MTSKTKKVSRSFSTLLCRTEALLCRTKVLEYGSNGVMDIRSFPFLHSLIAPLLLFIKTKFLLVKWCQNKEPLFFNPI